MTEGGKQRMNQTNLNGWRVLVKIVIAIATTLLGVLGAQEVGNED